MFMSRDRRSFLASGLVLVLSLLLLLTASLSSSLIGSLTLRHQLTDFYILSVSRGKITQPLGLSGQEVDRFRDRGLSLGIFRRLSLQGNFLGTKPKLVVIQLEPHLLSLLDRQLPQSRLGSKFSAIINSPDNAVVTQSFATRIGLRLGTGSHQITISDKRYRISGILMENDLKALNLAGLSGDVFVSLGRQDWARANLFSYQALFHCPTDLSLGLSRVETAAIKRDRSLDEQPQLTSVLEWSLGQWTRAVTAIRICCTVILLLVAVTLFALQWIRVASKEHDYIVHQMLGATRMDLVMSVVRQTIVEAGLGLLLCAITWTIVQVMPFESAVMALVKMPLVPAWWLFMGVVAIVVVYEVVVALIAISALCFRQSAEFQFKQSSKRQSNRTKLVFVFVTTLTAVLLLIVSLGSRHYLDAEFKGRFLGDPYDLVKVEFYLPLDKDYSGPNPEKAFRLEMQQNYRRIGQLLQPLALNGEVAGGYFRALEQISGTEKVSFANVGNLHNSEFPARMITISPGFIRLLRLPLLYGSDCSTAPVAGPADVLVNQAFLRKAAATANVLDGTVRQLSSRWNHRIRGVVADSADTNAQDSVTAPVVFLCDYSNAWELYFRAAGAVQKSAERAVQDLSLAFPQASLSHEVVAAEIDAALGNAQTQAMVAIVFASLAVATALTAMGVICLLTLREYRHPAAIMAALGASPLQVIRTLLGPIFLSSLAAASMAALVWIYLASGTAVTYEWGLVTRPHDLWWLAIGFLCMTCLPAMIAARQAALGDIASLLRDDN